MRRETKRSLTTLRRMDKPARRAYCTGCGNTFSKMHELINHRRTEKCGGRFLSLEELLFVDRLRLEREAQDRRARFFVAMEAF